MMAGAVLAAGCAGALAGCANDASPSGAPQADTSVPASAPVTVLPDDVPVIDGGRVVDGPATTPSVNGVTGWSAVVTTSPNTLAGTAADVAASSLGQHGYAITGRTSSADSESFTAHKGAPDSEQGVWVRVSVTTPSPSLGPIVTYRSATVH